jgi:elongation factor G
MNVDIMVPDEYMGQISGDINSRRGRVMGMDSKGKLQILKAQVPLAEMFKYANDLRSITGGRGTYSMRFSHYEEVPAKVASTIVAQSKKEVKEEEEV